MKLALIFLCSAVAANFCIAAPPASIEPSGANYRQWIQYIRPVEGEEHWKSIAWKNNFMPAIEEAKKLDRPVLLWTMNGNPCGET